METEKRLIDANEFCKDCLARHTYNCTVCNIGTAPTVDAVPVDEIRVDILKISLENQEAVLNISICGKPNEVKVPFSKEVAEVVHGYTLIADEPKKVLLDRKCSICDQLMLATDNYCPMCGAINDGEKI